MQIGQGARPLPRHRWQRLGICGVWEALVGPCLNVMAKVTLDKSPTILRLAGISVTSIWHDHGRGRHAGHRRLAGPSPAHVPITLRLVISLVRRPVPDYVRFKSIGEPRHRG